MSSSGKIWREEKPDLLQDPQNRTCLNTLSWVISEHPCLSADAERDLIIRIQDGKHRLQALSEQVANGNTGLEPELEKLKGYIQQMRDQFMFANIRLVVHIAKRYVRPGVLLADLVQDGCAGMLKALNDFDLGCDVRFATYATWRIRAAIQESSAHSRSPIATVPPKWTHKLWQFIEARNAFEENNGRQPTDEELAEILQVSPVTVGTIKKVGQVTNPVPIGELDNLSADDLESEKSLERADNRARIDALLKRLKGKRDAEVLRLRFGIDCGEPLTLSQVGRRLGITRERVRQIELRALGKLRGDPPKKKS